MAYKQVAPGAHSFAIGKAESTEAAGEVFYITCNFIDDKWNLHRPVHRAYMVLPPERNLIHNASTLLGVPVLPSQVAVGEHLLSHILGDYQLDYYYPLMVAGDITGSIIGHLELKRLMDQKLTSADDLEVIFFTASMDHVLHSIARCLLPDSNHLNVNFSNNIILDSHRTRQDCLRLLSELSLDDPLESNEPTLDSQTLLLCNLLGLVHSAIKRLSASGTPTSNLCLEELLKVRSALQSQLPAPSATHVRLTKALDIVDKAIEDSYLLWSLPLVLDPRYKLRHVEKQFQKTFGDSKAANYTSQVRSMVEVLYISYNDDDSDEDMMVANMTELDDYLKDSLARTPKGSDFDILKWWKVYGSVQYPKVARMARAALAMPTCSKLTSDQTAQVKSIIRGYTKI